MQSSSGENMEVIARHPWLVKAGIPLLLSAAAFITAKIISKNRASHVSTASEEVQEECSSSSSPAIEIESDIVEMLEGLKRREYELENRFFIYQDMKERESKAMEINSKMCLEMTRLEFLAREASLMEAEARGMDELMLEYLRVVKELKTSRWEKRLVEKKARKLRKRVGEKSKVAKERSVCIKARDEEITRNRRELERKNEVIVELEDEIRLIKGVVDQLKEEKIELLNKLEMVERSSSTKPKDDEQVVMKEAYDKVVEELERAEKDRETMENEMINLRWSNACLRHKVKSCQEQLESKDTDKNSHVELESSPKEVRKLKDILHIECDESRLTHDNEGPCSTQDGRFSRRKRFIRKLRKWVEGGKIDEKQKHNEMIKCFGGHSGALSEAAYENYVHPRNSFSSV